MSWLTFSSIYALVSIFDISVATDSRAGILLSNLMTVFICACVASVVWTSLRNTIMTGSEGLRITLGCLVSAAVVDSLRIILETNRVDIYWLVLAIVIGHIAISGFLVLAALHGTNRLAYR